MLKADIHVLFQKMCCTTDLSNTSYKVVSGSALISLEKYSHDK